jgi:hypothetical protein
MVPPVLFSAIQVLRPTDRPTLHCAAQKAMVTSYLLIPLTVLHTLEQVVSTACSTHFQYSLDAWLCCN